MQPLIVIVPVFNEMTSLPTFWPRLRDALTALPDCAPRVLFVDDGSADATRAWLQQTATVEDSLPVGYLALSRNFGKEAAILAGFDAIAPQLTESTLALLMDGDGQDPPALVAEMLARWREGDCDHVMAVRRRRDSEGVGKRGTSYAFQWTMRRFSDVQLQPGASDFVLLSAPVVRAIVQMREVNRFFKGMTEWVGFRGAVVPYDQAERIGGQSKWPLASRSRYALRGFTSYSLAPLRLVTFLGLAFAAIAFCCGAFIAVRTWIFGDAVRGYPTLIVTVLGMGGLQLFALGVIGEYLGRTLQEARRRPIYIVAAKSLPIMQATQLPENVEK